MINNSQLKAALEETLKSPKDQGTLLKIISRPSEDERLLLNRAEVTAVRGIPGDRWARQENRQMHNQISVINSRMLGRIAGGKEREALAGDNFIADLDLSEENMPAGQRIKIGTAILEVSEKPHTGCAKFSARFGSEALKFINAQDRRHYHLRGIFVFVVESGLIKTGDKIEKIDSK